MSEKPTTTQRAIALAQEFCMLLKDPVLPRMRAEQYLKDLDDINRALAGEIAERRAAQKGR